MSEQPPTDRIDTSANAVARLAIAMQLNGRNDVHDMLLALLDERGRSAPGAREALNELHQIDQEIFSPEPSGLQDMVPRSRYDAANKDWIEERDLRKKVSANAAEWIGLLSAALRKLVDITRDERKHLIPAALNEAAHALNWQPSDGVSPEPVAKPNPCRNECSLISLDDDHWKCNHCDAVFAYTGAQKPVEKPRCWWPLCKETAGDALCDAVQSALTKGEKP